MEKNTQAQLTVTILSESQQGNFFSALQSTQRSLNIRRKFLEKNTQAHAADSYHSLGGTQHEQGDLSLALQSKQRALDIRDKRFGEEDSSTADSYHSLGTLKTVVRQGDMS